MHYISKAEQWAIGLYPDNKENCNYKLSDYTIVEEYNDGYIVFNSITWSMYYLSKDEYGNVLSNDTLIKNKVVVDDSIYEYDIAEQAYLKRSSRTNTRMYDTINSYVVFTTNTCNAHCPYCYENTKIGSMSLETAEKFVNFAIKHKKDGKNLSILWFGGEPLKNIPIINYISGRLKNENIQFSSKMISNCSLFTPDLLDNAINIWNLKQLQVTFDGPEEMYNHIKNYDNINGSAFKVVLDNIENILQKSNIKVVIRINVSHSNIDSIQELIDCLNDRLISYSNLSYDTKILYQILNNAELLKKDDFETKFCEFVDRNFPDENRYLIKKRDLMKCMADMCGCVAVSPNGIFHNCEHISNDNIIGNIEEGITGTTTIEKTLDKGGKHLNICKENKCKLMPICHLVHFCEAAPRCTDKEFIKHENNSFIKCLKLTTEYYFKKLEEIKTETI